MITDELYDESGFFFRQRKGKLNLRKLEAIDLEKVIREVDIDLLQQCIENITFAELQDYDLQYLTDKQLLKLFRVSQLTIEYLLFTQRKLVNNLTDLAKKYSNKKKILYRKRKELTYLKEESIRLQIQLKTKRRNLQTLEKLIESANLDHDLFLQERSKMLASSNHQQSSQPQRGLIKFFVGFPDGMFIELEESSEITIKYVISVINNLLFYERSSAAAAAGKVTASSVAGVRKIPTATGGAGEPLEHPSMYDNNSQNIKLFLRGKLLMVNSTLSQNGVVDGDTLLATVAFPPMQSKEPEFKEEKKEAIGDQSVITKSLVEALTSQTDCIQRLAKEINDWRNVVNNTPKQVATPDNFGLADHLDQRLKLMELEIRESLKALPRPEDLKPRLVFGDLENDDDKFNPRFDALSSQMDQIGTAVRSMKSILEDQQIQVNELRRSLSDRVTISPVVPNIVIQNPPQQLIQPQQQQPIIIEKQVPVQSTTESLKIIEKTVVHSSSNKWNMLPVTNEELQEEVKPAVVPKEIKELPAEVYEPEKPKKVQETVEIVSTPMIKEAPKPAKSVEAPKPLEQPKPIVKKDPSTVLITFPYQHNPLLRSAMSNNLGVSSSTIVGDGVTLEIKADMNDKDEIIAVIRTMIAMQVQTKMQNVYLTLDGRIVKLAFDLPESLGFSPKEIVEYTATGKLQVGIHGLRALSNAQIDLLFPAFDQEKVKSSEKLPTVAGSAGLTKQKSNRIVDATGKTRVDSLTVKKDETDHPELQAISQIRGSLQNLLAELENVNALSDTDLAKKRKDLEAYSSTSEVEGLEDTRKSVIKSLGSMTLLGDDYPTEEYLERKNLRAMSKSGEYSQRPGGPGAGAKGGSKETSRPQSLREHKSLRLSQKSYEDYKRLTESVESLPNSDPRTSATALRKSVQRRNYYEDNYDEVDENPFFGEDSRVNQQRPYYGGSSGPRGSHFDEKSNTFQQPRGFPPNAASLSKPDFTTTLNSNYGDDTLVFSSDTNTPFNMTNNSSILSSTMNSSSRQQSRFLDTQEIQKRADHYEQKAQSDLYGRNLEDEEEEDDEDTLNVTNNTSNNSQNTRQNTTIDSPFKEFRRLSATENTNNTGGTNYTLSTTNSSSNRSRGQYPNRYADEDDEEPRAYIGGSRDREDEYEEKSREPFTPSALNAESSRRGGSGRRLIRSKLDESDEDKLDYPGQDLTVDNASDNSLETSEA